MRNGQTIPPQERDALIEQARPEPKLPSKVRMVKNFAKAAAKHIGDGLRKVSIQEYQDRLDICNPCNMRLKNRCTHESCGCFIDKKAWWASEECPLDKWFGV